MDKRKEDKFVNMLAKTGLSKNTARAFAYMAARDETTSREIEDNTHLRQPEVSIATNELRRMGWIDKRDIKKEGKGRPVHGYRLKKPLKDIIVALEKDEVKKIKEIEDNINGLKTLADSIR